MNKRVIATLCSLTVLLSCLTGCNKGEEPSESVSSAPSQVTALESTTTTESSSSVVPIDKVEWTGAQFDNPIDQEKFATLLSRVRTNLESKGIVVIGNEMLEEKPEDNPGQIVFDPSVIESTDTSNESGEVESSAISEEPTEEPFVLTIDVLYDMINTLMGIENETLESTSSATEESMSIEDNEESEVPEEVEQANILKSAVKDLFRALQTSGTPECFIDETGEAWADYLLYTAAKVSGIEGLGLKVSAEQMKLLDEEITADVLHFGYSLSDTRWYHSAYVSDIAGITNPNEYSKYFNNIGAVEDYTKLRDIGDWLIAPETPANSFKDDFNAKAQEWGVPNMSLDKVFMSGSFRMLPTAFASSEDKSAFGSEQGEVYTNIAYQTEYEDYMVLNQLINYLYLSGDLTFTALSGYMAKNHDNIATKAEELLKELYEEPEDSEEPEGTESEPTSTEESSAESSANESVVSSEEKEDDGKLIVTLDENGNSVLINNFLAWLKEDMTPVEYKELCDWISIDTLDYAGLKSVLSNTVINGGVYGFVNSRGVRGSIARNLEVVNAYNWQLGFPIGSKMITEDQLSDIVLTYVVYVGTFTNETYTRALDIALSGIVNKTTNSDYKMHLDYFDNAAVLYIDKA